MCLIIYKPKNVKFNQKHIDNALNFNSDGIGLSIRYDNNTVKVLRDVDYVDLIMMFDDLVKNEVVLHLRYATSGNKSWKQVHPFKVNKKTDNKDFTLVDNESILFHNGVAFSTNSIFSDTQILSRSLGNTDNLNKYVNQGNKFVIQDNDVTSFFGKFYEVDGMLYSNMSYHQDVEQSYKSRYKFKDDYSDYLYDYDVDDSFETCPCCGDQYCEKIGIAVDLYECLECSTIFDSENILKMASFTNKAV